MSTMMSAVQSKGTVDSSEIGSNGCRETDNAEIPSAQFLLYGNGSLCESEYVPGVTQLPELLDDQILWVKVLGIHDYPFVKTICEQFAIDDDLLEDTVDTSMRPRYLELDNGISITIKSIDIDPVTRSIHAEHGAMISMGQVVLTFQECRTHPWNDFVKRLRRGRHWNKSDPHYLVFSLVDTILDHYLASMGSMTDTLQELEDKLLDVQTQETLLEMFRIKREIALLRKNIWPLREIVQGLSHKRKSKKVSEYALDILRDIRDDVKEVIDLLNTVDNVITGLIDLNSSIADMTMNRVMKVLTVMGTIFLPLTFITSLYGMNFKNMPELEWHDGYYIVLGVMLAITLGMVWFFRRKRWI
ncbi:magnesium/cobalt transporter CorA [Desulfovibrio inopinatus]|uniref:magnesium/cobalt transporter CorA n=1 Tax=Desulfovibrio inopinatus TaxID=102109 RepID=UPI00146FA559|nr:magnesium/cobalt transporter CorA [Desulfovibrio inopinatus]